MSCIIYRYKSKQDYTALRYPKIAFWGGLFVLFPLALRALYASFLGYRDEEIIAPLLFLVGVAAYLLFIVYAYWRIFVFSKKIVKCIGYDNKIRPFRGEESSALDVIGAKLLLRKDKKKRLGRKPPFSNDYVTFASNLDLNSMNSTDPIGLELKLRNGKPLYVIGPDEEEKEKLGELFGVQW